MSAGRTVPDLRLERVRAARSCSAGSGRTTGRRRSATRRRRSSAAPARAAAVRTRARLRGRRRQRCGCAVSFALLAQVPLERGARGLEVHCDGNVSMPRAAASPPAHRPAGPHSRRGSCRARDTRLDDRCGGGLYAPSSGAGRPIRSSRPAALRNVFARPLEPKSSCRARRRPRRREDPRAPSRAARPPCGRA